MTGECCEHKDPKTCFLTSLWFTGLTKGHFITGIGGFKIAFLVLKVVFTAYWLPMWIFTHYELDRKYYSNSSSGDYLSQKTYNDFLSNWNDTIILFYLIYSMIIVAVHFRWNNLSDKAPWYFYIIQLVQEIALTNSTLVTVIFWILLSKPEHLSSPETIHPHIMNVVIMGLDFLLTGFPFRALHIVYVWVFAWTYVLATFIISKINPARQYFKSLSHN